MKKKISLAIASFVCVTAVLRAVVDLIDAVEHFQLEKKDEQKKIE